MTSGFLSQRQHGLWSRHSATFDGLSLLVSLHNDSSASGHLRRLKLFGFFSTTAVRLLTSQFGHLRRSKLLHNNSSTFGLAVRLPSVVVFRSPSITTIRFSALPFGHHRWPKVLNSPRQWLLGIWPCYSATFGSLNVLIFFHDDNSASGLVIRPPLVA